MRASRLVPLAAVLSISAAPIAAPAAHAAPAARTGGTERVLLTLTPHDRGLLRALAAGNAPAHSHRAASLAAALASQADRQDVAQTARSLGLKVVHEGRLAVLASGPASVVNSLFGSAREVAPRSRWAHPLPVVPEAFAGKVTAAFGGDDNRPAFRHFATAQGTADGTDLRTAYGDSNVDPTANTGVTHAIATVQLSGWHSADLWKFASDLRAGNAAWPMPSYTGIDDPSAPATVATSSTLSNGQPNPDFGNDMEVDLDQESLYAIDPYAQQRAYTSANDLAGMFDSLLAVGDDASDPTVDNHIVAASISWGQCESELARGLTSSQLTDLYNAFEDALSYVLATGVTVFAATGDTGAACGDPSLAPSPSYPASSPQVIAVGGTTATTPSDRTTQTGWADSNGASGGGASGRFSRPAYQASAVSGGQREVPDISALAGQPGFELYSTSPAFQQDPSLSAGYTIAGGTSLASPVATASYAAELVAHGYGWGIGDIHDGLYAQAADPAAFFDVTSSGSNGAGTAGPGYDMVTGIGTPVWSGLFNSGKLGGQPHFAVTKAFIRSTTVGVTEHQPSWQSFTGFRIDPDITAATCQPSGFSATPPTSYTFPAAVADGVHDLTLTAKAPDGSCRYADAFVFLDRARPNITAKLAIVAGSTRNIVATWKATDPNGDNGTGVLRTTVTLTGNGKTWHPTRSGARVTGAAGKAFTLTVSAVDFAGNVRTTTAHLLDDRNFSFARFWSRAHLRSAYGGSQASTSRKGAHAHFSAAGKAYILYVGKCADCGKLGVYSKSGHLLKVVDTYAGRTRYRVAVTILISSRYASRTLVVRALGTKNARSKGVRVIVDGLTTRA